MKIEDDTNRYVVDLSSQGSSVLNLSTNTMLNEVVVTYGDHGNPTNGIIHTVESCWNCSSTSINTTFFKSCHFREVSNSN